MRYLLDTVTLSEFRRQQRADAQVIHWQRACAGGLAFISVITLNELRYGVRKVARTDLDFAQLLACWYDTLVTSPSAFSILSVDRTIAELAADFRSNHGTPYNAALIAATAAVHGLTLATRNTADFQATGIQLVNPWQP